MQGLLRGRDWLRQNFLVGGLDDFVVVVRRSALLDGACDVADEA